MPSNIYLISNINGTVTNYYLSNSTATLYSGSGTPWTAQSTSPYQIGMNERTGQLWTPKAAPSVPIYSGGPPFGLSKTLVFRGYDAVTETIPIQIRATTHDNAVTLLQTLRRVLKTTLFSRPPVLAVQPNNATNTVYFEIYDGDIQESADFINEEAGRGLLRAQMTITRSAVGGVYAVGSSAAETAINAQTFGNTGTGSPNNTVAYSSSMSGDFIYEGSPLNFTDINVSNVLHLASVYSRTYTANTTAISTTDTTSAGVAITSTTVSLSTSNVLAARGLSVRALWRLTQPSSNLQVRSSLNTAWRTPTAVGPGNATLVDLGGAPLGLDRLGSRTSITLTVTLYARSLNGATATATSSYIEILLYYTFCTIDGLGSSYASVFSFNEANGVHLPYQTPYAHYATTSSSATPSGLGRIRGQTPLYFSGASLYAAWLGSSDIHSTSATTTITAKHAPLWKTLRGSD